MNSMIVDEKENMIIEVMVDYDVEFKVVGQSHGKRLIIRSPMLHSLSQLNFSDQENIYIAFWIHQARSIINSEDLKNHIYCLNQQKEFKLSPLKWVS